MKKLAIITDAWLPQVNGVVNTYLHINPFLKQKYQIEVLHPMMFTNFSYPWYKEIKIAINTKKITEKFFGDYDPDVIHIATEGPVGIAGKKFCENNKLRYTTSFHTRFPEYIEQRIMIPKIIGYSFLKNFHKNACNVLVPTISMRNELTKYQFQNLKIWSRGVNTELFNPLKRKKGMKKYIVYIGRVSLEKNIEAFLEIRTKMDKIVVGDGPEKQRLQNKYPYVSFVGMKKGQDLANYYANAEALVFPSKTDTFGNVILESLASGTPVAAYPVTGPKDILKNSLIDSLDNDIENSLKKALKIDRNDCRKFAMQFTWDRCANQFLSNIVNAKN